MAKGTTGRCGCSVTTAGFTCCSIAADIAVANHVLDVVPGGSLLKDRVVFERLEQHFRDNGFDLDVAARVWGASQRAGWAHRRRTR